ncbi:unnamed protein product [Paramecium pentaurelia]|uniref:Transmembrane protein n=1 Tax=Paramecium pentaurelia TaxID=43138 RepID=A0A8S1UL59_9CILI|nr:unnamed protein product [Paramecium pentaurelia]
MQKLNSFNFFHQKEVRERTLKNLCSSLHKFIQKKYQFINKIFLFQNEQEITQKESNTSSFIFFLFLAIILATPKIVNHMISTLYLLQMIQYLNNYQSIFIFKQIIMFQTFRLIIILYISHKQKKGIIKIYPQYQQNYGLYTILKIYCKLQTYGFKTALKILFKESPNEFSCNFMRNELVLYINTFGNILSSFMIQCMRKAHNIILIQYYQLQLFEQSQYCL